MAISTPFVGTRVNGDTGSPTSAVVDISGAGDGDEVFIALSLGDAQTAAVTAPTGWTVAAQGSEGTSGGASSRSVLYKRTKVSGDTTFTFTWGVGCKFTAQVVSWPGVDSIEGATYLAHTANTTSFLTASITPTAADRWIAMVAHARSSVVLDTFTPDAAMTERDDGGDVGNPRNAQEIADTAAAVTQTAHTYTAVSSAAESHGGTIVWALIPATISETDVAVAAASETDTAHAVTPIAGSTVAAVTETDTAHAILPVTGTPVGVATETDTAHTVTAVKTVTVTAVQDSAWPPRIIVTIVGLNSGTMLTIFRVQQGVRTALRAATDLPIIDTGLVRFDGEYSFGTPTTYALNVDGTDVATSVAITPTLPGGNVALSDAITGLAVECKITAWPDRTSDKDAVRFHVGGRTVVVSRPRGGFESQIELMTETGTTREQMDALMAAATSGIVMIRVPSVLTYPGFDTHLALLSDDQRIFVQSGTDARRLWTLGVVSSAGWAPALAASGNTYQMVIDVYDGLTYADLAADFDSYLDMEAFDWPSIAT